ncbi:hypothetical protein Esti_000769 [Eimeria stiedai]
MRRLARSEDPGPRDRCSAVTPPSMHETRACFSQSFWRGSGFAATVQTVAFHDVSSHGLREKSHSFSFLNRDLAEGLESLLVNGRSSVWCWMLGAGELKVRVSSSSIAADDLQLSKEHAAASTADAPSKPSSAVRRRADFLATTEEACATTTAPATPSSLRSAEGEDLASRRSADVLSRAATPCDLGGSHAHSSTSLRSHKTVRGDHPAGKPLCATPDLGERCASTASGLTDASSNECQPESFGGRCRSSAKVHGARREHFEALETTRAPLSNAPLKTAERSGGLSSCATCLSAGGTCIEHLLQQYHHRRSVFEINCSQRYGTILEVVAQKRRASGLLKLGVCSIESQKQHSRVSAPQARTRKGHEADGGELTASSSGEEPQSRGAHGSTGVGVAGAERDSPFREGGFIRRTKGIGQRSFPYRQFHVHHFLPEPENKVGLLTHPTPAQFNKYPKARGVWFDPHRNLVRTCWKENGKAKTMGFPVNKFGLEEARTLAVEYHYYKCPSDPLPDDLLSLVPRKPPHAYGWC